MGVEGVEADGLAEEDPRGRELVSQEGDLPELSICLSAAWLVSKTGTELSVGLLVAAERRERSRQDNA